LATELLTALNQEIANQPIRDLKTALLLVNNPMTANEPKEREQYKQLQTKLSELGQKGNSLATAVLAVKETSTDTVMKALLEQIKNAQAKNDDVASTVMILVGDGLSEAAPEPARPTESAPVASAAPAAPTPTPAAPPPISTMGTPAVAAPVAPATSAQNSAGLFNPPAPTTPAATVDSTPPPAVGSNGSQMQPASAYNYSGIPMSARRPINYIAPQTRQEEIE
jgi:hypothetical protein